VGKVVCPKRGRGKPAVRDAVVEPKGRKKSSSGASRVGKDKDTPTLQKNPKSPFSSSRGGAADEGTSCFFKRKVKERSN